MALCFEFTSWQYLLDIKTPGVFGGVYQNMTPGQIQLFMNELLYMGLTVVWQLHVSYGVLYLEYTWMDSDGATVILFLFLIVSTVGWT